MFVMQQTQWNSTDAIEVDTGDAESAAANSSDEEDFAGIPIPHFRPMPWVLPDVSFRLPDPLMFGADFADNRFVPVDYREVFKDPPPPHEQQKAKAVADRKSRRDPPRETKTRQPRDNKFGGNNSAARRTSRR